MQQSPSGRMLVRWVGSTLADAETRVRTHVATRRQTQQWNADLARLLDSGTPRYKVLATVPDDERFAAERELTRRYRRHHRLLNVLDGSAHTEESRRRIKAGLRRRRALC